MKHTVSFWKNTKQECIDKVLGFDFSFGARESLLFRFLLDKPEKWVLLKSARRTCKLFVDNPRIRDYIDKRFEQEKTVHELVDTMETRRKKTRALED